MTENDNLDLTRFECLGCGACCRQSGHVRLRPEEPDIISDFLNMDVLDFIETFTCLTRDRNGLSIIDAPGGACIFLDNNGCRINPVKPAQCRDFPVKWRFSNFEQICGWALKLGLHPRHMD
ncbi:YkgJ family cysteine cluster protein [uncultured Desulfobacter sp.]|uniref:YkgJ family cysteine cluster protein n=1 Tax=uncultured Desulfobacter sp. TaxID=240139 RepID=UPI002AABF6CD|nr:YkgJ family cysteine cluster protein [uncultured Desulfobacter sp.]